MIYVYIIYDIICKFFKEGMRTDERRLLLSVRSVGQSRKELRFNSSLIFSLIMKNDCYMGKHWEKVSVVIGSLAVENSLLQDPQGMILFYQWGCRNGFASQYPFRPQPSFRGTDDIGELVQLNHLSVPLPLCIGELPFLQCTVSHAGLSLRTTSRGSDLVELEQSPPI